MPTQKRRYGEYPGLFWDLKPEETIDVYDPTVLARILTEGTLDQIAELISLDLLRRKLDELVIPEHTRAFWRRVLTADGDSAAA
jgi:hypothetical protein